MKTKFDNRYTLLAGVAVITTAGCMSAALGMASIVLSKGMKKGGEVNLYSYRQPFLINPFLDGFTKQTGIKVNVTIAPKGMVQSLKADGRTTPTDGVLTVDISRLWTLTDKEDLPSPLGRLLNYSANPLPHHA